MRDFCFLWILIILANYYAQAEDVYFEMMDKKNIHNDKLHFYKILPNNSTSRREAKVYETAETSSENVSNITEERLSFEEYEAKNTQISSENVSRKIFKSGSNDILTVPVTDVDENELVSTATPYADGIPDDFWDSPNVVRVTIVIPLNDEDKSDTGTSSDTTSDTYYNLYWFIGIFIAGVLVACYSLLKKKANNNNQGNRRKYAILVVRKSEEV